ncbi:MAG: hypothetical protein ACRC6P_09650 [Shewanella oncorhynchi]
MTPLKTFRGQALRDSALPMDFKLALAATDYFNALKHPGFTDEWGSAADFHHDLLLFVELYWETYKKKPEHDPLYWKLEAVRLNRPPRD